MSVRTVIGSTLALVLAIPALALAQAPQTPARAPRGPARPIDIAAGGTFAGPTSFGSASQDLVRPDGSAFPVFRADNRLAPGFGLEAHLAFGLTPTVWVEATGSWSTADLETEISSDVEDADGVTLSDATSRFTVEGGVRWAFWTRGRTTLFARGSLGWMRELAGAGSLVEDGLVGTGGVSLRHWLRERRAGARTRRIGLRVDGRLNVRTAGLTLGEEKARYTPVVFGGIVFGF
jgi:hypothetical protein